MLALFQVGWWWFAIDRQLNLEQATGISLGVSFVAAIVLERLRPERRDWAMTRGTFFGRDYKYFLLGLPLLNVVIPFVATILSLELVGPGEPRLSPLPLVIEVVLAVAGFDFLQYWYHRASHRLPYRGGILGSFGRRLWTVHSSHHQPEQVYVLMHPIGHPIDMFIIRLGFQIAFFSFAGFSAEAIFVTGCLLGFQGIIGHCNSDIRMGPLSYVLTGTETHRLHHSSNPNDDGNFAVVFILWDVLFGTFIYNGGGHTPTALGVYNQDATVPAGRFWATMAAPFTKSAKAQSHL